MFSCVTMCGCVTCIYFLSALHVEKHRHTLKSTHAVLQPYIHNSSNISTGLLSPSCPNKNMSRQPARTHTARLLCRKNHATTIWLQHAGHKVYMVHRAKMSRAVLHVMSHTPVSHVSHMGWLRLVGSLKL